MCCYCIDMYGGFLRQVPRSTKDEGGDYNFEVSHDGFKLIKKNLSLKLLQIQYMTIKDYEVTQKTLPQDFVMTMSH